MAFVSLQWMADEAAEFEALERSTTRTTVETVDVSMSATERREIKMTLFLRLRLVEEEDDLVICRSDGFSATCCLDEPSDSDGLSLP
ncbi:hypothetical protein ACFX2A_041547 [Malus domestica]